MRKWFTKHVIGVSIILLVSGIFCSRLFFPQVKLIATPEFELHDSIQLSYASKWWYFQKLHDFKLPIWSNQIGGGFPILGEGQTGIFFLPNILIFGLSPNPDIAYNLTLTLVPITMALGLYVWFTMLGIPWAFSLLGSLTAALSGFTIFHLQHMSLLQGFSLIPMLMAATLGMSQKKPKPWIFLFIILVSQQFFTGFVQAVVIGGMFSFTYYVFLIQKQPNLWKRIIIYLLATIAAIGVSAIQFLPSLEFLRQISSWERSNPDWPTQYSFSIQFLLTFIHPFLIGNPALGTYKGNGDSGSIYWENIGFVGLIPIVLTLYALFSKRIRKDVMFFFLALVVAFFLMLGKYSPFYFVFNFFPLNLFRVPARFVYVFALSFIIIATKTSVAITKNRSTPIRVIVIALWVVNLMILFPMWTTYHPLTSPSQVHEAPPITTIIPQSAYLYRFNVSESQRVRYFTYGYTNMKRYDFFKNTLMPNTNTFWKYTVSDAYPSRFLKRPAILDALFLRSIEEDKKMATISAIGRTVLALTPTDWILSGEPIDSEGVYPLQETLRDDDASLYIYSVPNKTPWAFFPTSWKVFSTLTDMGKIINEEAFDPRHTVLLEKPIPIQTDVPLATQKPTIVQTTQEDGVINIKVEDVEQDALLTIGMTYYPGWIAKVDGKKTTIFPVNIRNMGIIVPRGTKTIEFIYMPVSLIIGAGVSVVFLIFSTIFLVRRKVV